MEYYVSISTKNGNESRLMKRQKLSEALKFIIEHPYAEKCDCWLLSNGYKDTTGLYTREEFNFQWIDTIMLDVDNDKEKPNTNLLEQFKKEYEPYTYFLWESASSTEVCPKFRVIIPLDRRVAWYNEPIKFTKKAVLNTFGKYHDNKASWYFSPTTAKVGTFVAHRGKPYPASVLENKVKVDMMFAQLEEQEREIKEIRNKPRKRNPDGWRNLPSVKKCLDGLHVGERDNSINAACYAMNKNGYRSSINEFLDEVLVEESIKAKFRGKYR